MGLIHAASDAHGLFFRIAVIGARQLTVLCIVCAFLLAGLQVVAPRIWPERAANAENSGIRSKTENANQGLDVDLFQKTITISAIGLVPVFLAAGITIYVYALSRSARLSPADSESQVIVTKEETAPLQER